MIFDYPNDPEELLYKLHNHIADYTQKIIEIHNDLYSISQEIMKLHEIFRKQRTRETERFTVETVGEIDGN